MYGTLVIFIGFLGFVAAALFHLHVSKKNQKSISGGLEPTPLIDLFLPLLGLTIIFSIMIVVTFVRNRKLR